MECFLCLCNCHMRVWGGLSTSLYNLPPSMKMKVKLWQANNWPLQLQGRARVMPNTAMCSPGEG